MGLSDIWILLKELVTSPKKRLIILILLILVGAGFYIAREIGDLRKAASPVNTARADSTARPANAGKVHQLNITASDSSSIKISGSTIVNGDAPPK